MDKKKEIIQWLIIINLIFAGLFLFSKLEFILSPIATVFNAIFLPIVLAVFLYYLVRPLKRFLQSKKISSGFATALSIALVLVVIIFTLYYSVSIFASQGESFLQMLTASAEVLSDKYAHLAPEITSRINISGIITQISEYLSNSFTDIYKNVYFVASSVGNLVAQLVLIPIIMFYILKDDTKIFDSFINFVPKRSKKLLLKILNDIDVVLKQYITCQVMVACVIGVLMFIGYVLLGMPNALVLALFSLITAFIPFLGVILGILPALIISLSLGFGMLMKIIILTVVVQQLEGNVITPNITGNQLNMHPLTTILVVTVSVYFGGFMAAFIAVPLYNIIKVIIRDSYEYAVTNK